MTPRRKFDWVYRGKEWSDDGVVWTTNNATYSDDEVTVTAGAATAFVPILYDAQNYLQSRTGYSVAGGQFRQTNRAARAEGRKPLIKATEGVMLVRPSTWAIGNRLHFVWRIMIGEQDPESGSIVLNADYTACNPAVTVPFTDVSGWRNQNVCLAEGFVWKSFGDNGQTWLIPWRWRGKRTLGAEQGLFLYIEAQVGGSNINPILTCRGRTLVSDEA